MLSHLLEDIICVELLVILATIMQKLLLKGLEKLEYRGYDSAGIAVVNDDGTKLLKKKEELLNYVKLQIIVMRMVR